MKYLASIRILRKVHNKYRTELKSNAGCIDLAVHLNLQRDRLIS